MLGFSVYGLNGESNCGLLCLILLVSLILAFFEIPKEANSTQNMERSKMCIMSDNQ